MPRPTPKSTSVYSKGSIDGGMEDYGSYDVPSPSPSNSMYYMYGEPDQYLDSHTSESQSPSGSLVSSTLPPISRRRKRC